MIKRQHPDPAWFPAATKKPEDLIPEGHLTAQEFVHRCHNVRTGEYDYNAWFYDVSIKRDNISEYPNYYSAWDNAYRNHFTNKVVYLYVPNPGDLTEEIRQEAATTIAKITGRSETLIRRWLGLDPPDVDAYLRAWLDCPYDKKLYQNYCDAVRLSRKSNELSNQISTSNS